MPWNPDIYHKFQTQRSAPFDDLLAMVDIRPDLRVVDLGCGSGELTRRLADSLPGSNVLGLDASQQMLERAHALARHGLRFELGDLAALTGEWDLVLSNAALQWSEDHERLIPYLFDRLAPGGQIAVQVPSNQDHISHRITLTVAGREPFRAALHGWTRRSPVLSIDTYARLLFQCQAQEMIIFEKVYPHVLENADAILDWISGTALVPYFERLDSLKDEFLSVLRQELRAAIPGEAVFYPFRRTFFSAKKGIRDG